MAGLAGAHSVGLAGGSRVQEDVLDGGVQGAVRAADEAPQTVPAGTTCLVFQPFFIYGSDLANS